MQAIKEGILCKHFKGHSLEEKNIYQIIHLNVTYSGDNLDGNPSLCVYEEIFKKQLFARETTEVFAKLPQAKQTEYNQTYRVEPLTDAEIAIVNTKEFKEKKKQLIKK